MMNRYLDVNPEVAAAVAEGRPVVALESTIISHGMPYPQNVETALNVEKAYIIASAQPSTAHTGNLYNVTRGEISFQELAVAYNGFPISGRIVNQKGAEFLDWINEHTCFDEMQFGYNILMNDKISPGNTGTNTVTSPTVDKSLGLADDDLDADATGADMLDSYSTEITRF